MRQNERTKYNDHYYNEHYWREDRSSSESCRFSYNDPDHARRFRYLADLIARWTSPKAVADVGCGEGGLVRALNDLGIPTLGIDSSSAGVARASRANRGLVIQASIEAIPLRTGSVDVVSCIDVLEHIPVLDIQDGIAELVRVSNRLVVATINLDNVYTFHPTILSRESWISLFQACPGVAQDIALQESLQETVRKDHPEYEFFVFRTE